MKHQITTTWKCCQSTIQYAALVILFLSTTATITPAQTIEQIAEKALAATVYLEMQDSTGEIIGIGSGFFVQQDLIATNYHVIEGAARGTAKLVGKYSKYTIEGVTATDKDNDLVLLKVSAFGIKPLPLGNSDRVKIGTQVYVVGSPKGLEGTFSDGIISSKRGDYANQRLQMTAPVSPGSSGGPVLNAQGDVVGISFMTVEGGQNLNFAIPSKYLKSLSVRLGRVRPLSSVSPTVSAETYFSRGNVLDELGDYRGAIEAYNAAIRLKPSLAEAYLTRGVAKARLGQDFAAISDFGVAIRLKPDFAVAYSYRGIVKARLGQDFAAISDYDVAIRLKPDYAVAYCNRGLAKYYLGEHFSAISDYDVAIRLKPDYADAYLNRGLAKARLGQDSAAISDYDIAIRLKPDDADAYFNRGVAKARLGEHFSAISDYDVAIRLKPDYAVAYLVRGIAKRKLGEYFAAISDYDVAIRLKPDDADAYFNRGVAKALLNRTYEAKQDLRTALRFVEKSGDAELKARIEKAFRLLE